MIKNLPIIIIAVFLWHFLPQQQTLLASVGHFAGDKSVEHQETNEKSNNICHEQDCSKIALDHKNPYLFLKKTLSVNMFLALILIIAIFPKPLNRIRRKIIPDSHLQTVHATVFLE